VVLGVALMVSGKGLRVHKFEAQGYRLGLMVEGQGFDVLGSGCLVQGVGFRV